MKGLRRLLTAVGLCSAALAVAAPTATGISNEGSGDQAMIARARALELPTPYVPPPGNPLEHYASGYAKVICSAVFVTGLDPDFAEQNVGFFTAPYEVRSQLGKPKIDRAARSVEVTVPGGAPRIAKRIGSQGCVTLPLGRSDVLFQPSIVQSALPPPDRQPWPTGDAGAVQPLPPGVDAARLQRAVDAAFDPAGMTAAFVVTYKGRIIAERYGGHITAHTPLESWSMGKSLVATLLGVLIQQGVYTLEQRAPIPEWQTPGDPRAKIRIEDIMRMSSGLRIRSPFDPGYEDTGTYPDHLYLYTAGENVFKYAATRPQEWPPNTVGRYRNVDPVLGGYLIRLAVEKRHEDYHSFPQRALFDKIGIRTMMLDTDAYGNFIMQGYEQASGRDWARLGNLYLQDGVWNGERILPPGFAKFVGTVAPAWLTDHNPVYGAFFWVNGDGKFPAPKDAYYMNGAGGQFVLIIPSRQLVIVRLGHFRGENAGIKALAKAMGLIMQAVPSAEAQH